MFSQACVIPSVHIGGGGLHPGWVGQTPLPFRILWDMVNERAVRILLECILVAKCPEPINKYIAKSQCEKALLNR